MTQKQKDVCALLTKRDFNVKEIVDFFYSHGATYWSWGAEKLTNYMNKGLHFKVNGHHHKGYVFIALDWSDTFDVHIISTQGKILNTYTEVYIFDLFETIDNRIERIPEYVR